MLRPVPCLIVAAAVVLGACLHYDHVSAQALPDSLAGHRVRLFLVRQPMRVEGNAPGQQLRGTVIAVTPDTLTLGLHPSAAPLAVAATGIRRIDFSHGARGRLEGAVRGGILGAGSLGLVSVLMAVGSDRPPDLWQAGMAGAALGGVLGGVTGAMIPLERWKRVRWR